MTDCFCVVPFFAKEYFSSGRVVSCCLLPPGSNIDEIKKDLLSNKRAPACSACWNLEDQNLISDRKLKNEVLLRYLSTDDLKKEVNSDTVRIVKLYTSNLCNSTCVTCGPNLSTAWANLEGKSIKINTIDDRIKDRIDWSKIKVLSFVGGEPLYEKKNFDILENLINIGNTDCTVGFVTNGSFKLVDYKLSILQQFKNLIFCVSIDGIGPVFDYLRYPLKWDEVEDNIKSYKSYGITLSVSYTISNLNVLYHKETTEWFKKQNLPYNYNLVTNPRHFSVNALPADCADLEFVTAPDEVEYQNFLKEIQRQDNLKGISIKDYLPELCKKLNI